VNGQLTLGNHGLAYAALTDVGLVRSKNQDSVAVAVAGTESVWRERGHVFVVADGMGAHAAGELASKIAVDTVPLSYEKQSRRSPPDALVRAMEEANYRIYDQGQANEEYRGMGTTLSTLVLVPPGALVAHVGDSRVYRLRGNMLEQLTFDHSLVWEVCEAEGISEAEVPLYIPRNVITRSVGSRPEVQVDLEGPFPLQKGDTFLLCSDGLCSQVENKQLGTVLRCLPPEEAARALIDLAISRGGPDNITAIVVHFGEPQPGHGKDDNGSAPAETSPGSAGIWIWSSLAALVSGSVGWLASHHMAGVVAAAAVGAGLAAGTVALTRRGRQSPWHRRLEERSLGRGPYNACHCAVNQQSVEVIGKTVARLRGVAESEKWDIHWQKLQAFGERADAAVQSEDYPQAIREHCGAISFLVSHVRAYRDEATTDDDLLAD
jgi:protein phosphatase